MAENIGTVSGDGNGGTVTATGTTSKWLKVRVSEDDSSVLGAEMRVSAKLLSPPGQNFDLALYVNEGSDVLECATVGAISTRPMGQSDEASLKWGESGLTANGVNDDRWVTLEVRAASGTTCSASDTWTLTFYGH